MRESRKSTNRIPAFTGMTVKPAVSLANEAWIDDRIKESIIDFSLKRIEK
jgi:hypothetical protein